MNPILKQARDGFILLIKVNKTRFTYQYKTDPDKVYSPTVTKSFIGRISHERAIITGAETTGTGVNTHLAKYLSYPHSVGKLQEDVVITDRAGSSWKVGKADALEIAGGIYSYQCALTEVTT